MSAADRGYLIGISLADGHRRKVLRARGSDDHLFSAGSFYIRSFEDEYKADVNDFDFLLMEWPKEALRRIADEAGLRATRLIEPITARDDPALLHIARAILQCFPSQHRSDRLLVDQLALAIQIHIVGRHLGPCEVDVGRRRMLTKRQETIAKEMLASALDGKVLISSIAEACGLSESYFIRAFRITTGCTPHRWSTQIRIERARDLLERTRKPIVDIAAECGFADQSHFTRVFVQSQGSPPGAWRRQRDCFAGPRLSGN